MLELLTEIKSLRKEVENLRKSLPPLVPPNGSLDSPLPPLPPVSGSRSRASRLPDDWSLRDEDYGFAEKLGLDVENTFDSFCDFWRAKAGANGAKLDWPATWRNWCRKDAANRKPAANGRSNGQSTTEHRPLYAALRDPTEIMAEIEARDRAKEQRR